MSAVRTKTAPRTRPAALVMSLWVALCLCVPGFILAAELVVPGPDTPTLAAALRLAEPGDQLLIKPGVYRERITLSKPLTLRAVPDAQGQVILDGEVGGEW